MVHGDMDETSIRHQRVYRLPVENFILLVSEEAECASTRERNGRSDRIRNCILPVSRFRAGAVSC